ncbi:MAG: response regulator [Thermodesulfovibrionales bacterium]|nr:response regulator [Thermodesulfovibrionales bacterium]
MDEIALIYCDIMKKRGMGAGLKEILVIDDEEFISDILSIVLSELGYSVTALQDGTEALKYITEREYWAIFCDLKMPGLDGFEVYEKAVELRPELKNRFVLLTGTLLDKSIKELIEKRGMKILFKPFNFEDVSRLLRELEKSHVE